MRFIPAAVLDSRSADLWQRLRLEPGFDAEALLDSLDLNLLWGTLDEADGERVLGALLARDRLVVLNELELAHRDVGGVPRSGRPVPLGQGVLFVD